MKNVASHREKNTCCVRTLHDRARVEWIKWGWETAWNGETRENQRGRESTRIEESWRFREFIEQFSCEIARSPFLPSFSQFFCKDQWGLTLLFILYAPPCLSPTQLPIHLSPFSFFSLPPSTYSNYGNYGPWGYLWGRKERKGKAQISSPVSHFCHNSPSLCCLSVATLLLQILWLSLNFYLRERMMLTLLLAISRFKISDSFKIFPRYCKMQWSDAIFSLLLLGLFSVWCVEIRTQFTSSSQYFPGDRWGTSQW